jgi:hypothetical protein
MVGQIVKLACNDNISEYQYSRKWEQGLDFFDRSTRGLFWEELALNAKILHIVSKLQRSMNTHSES